MKSFVIILLVILAVGATVYYGRDAVHQSPSASQYKDQNLGLSFKYDGVNYVVEESMPSQANPDLIKTIVIMRKTDYESLKRGERSNGEYPPAITISAYRNPSELEAQAWAENNGNISNLPLIMGEIMQTQVDGNRAIAYDADGLYANRNVVFAKNNRIYHLNGSYIDRNSPLYRDFEPLVNSIKVED